ncbi:hypothetical protein BBR47_19350 [Brevibacillus brevis NBRC 100599]|uniref:Uncharacterized protein n=1 Tax=Brevibacillus brevis (strain 47 / JCM 6285 / NBRC 100599) TaxID=358681 RepID=C0ZAV3_BREBN|nr:hypothetical protein [Brevibacillus brevis]BAH42912.1 hypothetical protein BBR47_19350 [Brevibacillus brevis NBRC 100599]
MGCQHCGGLGYTVEKTGEVSPHIPYTEETYKEPCECWLEEDQKKQSSF